MKLQLLFPGDDGVLLYPPHPTPAPYHGQGLTRLFNYTYTAIFNATSNPVTQVRLIFTVPRTLINFLIVSGTPWSRPRRVQSLPRPPRKNHTWEADIVEGLPPVQGLNAYLSLLEPFSGFRLAFPCKKTVTAKKIVSIFETHIIQVFGVPELISTDGGPNLVRAQEFQKFLKLYNIEGRVSAPYSPKSHGRIEVSNKSISTLCKILSDQYSLPWVRVLNLTILALNNRPYAHLASLSPFEVMFGFQHGNLKERITFVETLMDVSDQKLLFSRLQEARKASLALVLQL